MEQLFSYERLLSFTEKIFKGSDAENDARMQQLHY